MNPYRAVFGSHWFAPRRILIAALCSITLLSFFPQVSADEHASNPVVLELKIDGEVEPILATYIDEGITDAANRHASLILITMDTPGGLSDSMKDIIQHILSSSVPVAVYVYPTGSRAASAGFYILLSADIAAMAPGTHTGAASPLIAVGGYPVAIDETLRRKITNDAQAFLRSFAEKRGRNPKLAETAVTDAKAFTEKEALDGKLIDLIANSEDDLLRQLNGREITRFDDSKVKLALANPVRIPFELSARQKFLSRIVQPDVFFILLILGVLGAMFLIRSPLTPGGVSLGVALAVTLPFALLTVFLMRLVLRSRSWKNQTGREEMIGAQGTVVTELPVGAEGMIRIHGELWRAISNQPVPEGKPVRVVKMDGLKLYVEPVS